MEVFEGFKCRILVLKSVNDFLTVNGCAVGNFLTVNDLYNRERNFFSALRTIHDLFNR